MLPFLRHDIVRRLGFWALLQALPSESALKTYLKSVFLALCSAVIGSILFGALIAAGMMILYQSMVVSGLEQWIAASAAICAGLAILGICVMLFFRAIRNIAVVRNDETVRIQVRQSPLGRLGDALRDGFRTGYQSR